MARIGRRDRERRVFFLAWHAWFLCFSGTTLRNLALAAYELGKVTEAEKTLKRILDDPASDTSAVQDAQSSLAMLAFLRERNDPAKALTDATEILSTDPGHVPAMLVQAVIQADRGEADAAVAIYEEILERLPDFALAQKGLASVYALMPGKTDAAHKLASQARTVLTEDIELIWTFAELNKEKDPAYTRQLLQEIVRNKAPETARELYFFARAQQSLGQVLEANSYLNRALKAGLQGSLAAEAKQALGESRASVPAH
ncbi:MAG: tetratricopeptide repeat protein [Verrucomicrobiales bacterium]